jgi:N-formylglutamate amidohydrolase
MIIGRTGRNLVDLVGFDEANFGLSSESLPPELRPCCEVLDPESLTLPLVFSSPHSGSVYPASFLAAARLDAMALRTSEDVLVDDLFAAAPQLGAPLLRALFPRAFLDVNREPYELDPKLFSDKLPSYANTRSLRVASGLGTIARVVAEAQEIYSGRMKFAEALARIDGLYKPYHRVLKFLMDRAHGRFGYSILIDCHSMPSRLPAMGGARGLEAIKADFVIGDRHGTSCEPILTELVESSLKRMGYAVARNKPYAGGFITEHYSAPAEGRHVLQIEINRAIYLNEKEFSRGRGYLQVKADIGVLIDDLARAQDFFGRRHGMAAE